MKMDSTAGNADRVRRKVKVAVGKSKGLGVLTPETKDRNADGYRGKAKFSKQKSKGSSDGVRTSLKDEKPKGRSRDTNDVSKRSRDDVRVVKPMRNQQSRGYDNDTASNGSRNEKSTKSPSWERRDLKTKSGDRMVVEGRVHERSVRNFDHKPNFKVKPTLKFKGTESPHKRSFGGQTEGPDKRKRTEASFVWNKTSKKTDRMRVPLVGRTERGKYSIDSATKSRKNMFQSRKSLTRDSELIEGPPKKKKRGIRLDRHDTSNKRLDDDRAKNENQENKISTGGSEGEISKNAQFRAIIPSSSILSFVEDNMLGRRREIEFKRAGYNIEFPSPLDNLPFSTNSERERIEVPVFRNKLEFYAAAKISSSFPAPELPEIAFAGRSNVGKSSLLNSLTRQWGVVRTSDKPGLTQTINFFKLGPKLSLVDLPGYGFAYAKDEVKESWEELVKEYVSSRVGLKRVCLLVDTKWGLKPRDHELIELMERSETKYQIVLTKTDLVFPVDVARRAMQIEESLRAKKSAVQPLMMISSKTGGGIRSLRTALVNILKLARR